MKILIIRLSSIGDCVLSSPVLEALRDRYPDAHITWAVQPKSLSVVQGLPGLDEILLWDTKSHEKGLRQALRHTWKAKFDVALDLQGLDKAAPFLLASRAKRRISGTSARFFPNKMSNEHVEESEYLHARLFYLRRATLLDIAPDAASRYYPRIPVTSEHEKSAAAFLLNNNIQPGARLVGLNLGASDTEKLWSPERFAQLAHLLLEGDSHLRVVVFGAKGDVWLHKRFETEFQRVTQRDEEYSQRVTSAVGALNLMEVAVIARKCSVFISADTGPMHIAAAAGAPLLALFGPTDSHHTAPVHKPGNPPIKVLDGRDITGSWPASMSVWSVSRVLEEACELMAQVEAGRSRKLNEDKTVGL